jgi:hypothetical protein
LSEYIIDMAGELACLANQAKLPLVAYLLHLVRSEAAKPADEASHWVQRDEVAAVTREPASNLQLEEKRAHVRGRALHRPDQIVDADRRWAK